MKTNTSASSSLRSGLNTTRRLAQALITSVIIMLVVGCKRDSKPEVSLADRYLREAAEFQAKQQAKQQAEQQERKARAREERADEIQRRTLRGDYDPNKPKQPVHYN